MTIALSSLRIEATLDASAYVAGAKAKADADAKMVDSGTKVAGSLDQTERRLTTSASGFEKFQRSLDPAYASQQKFQAGAQTLQRALDSGNISTERHADLLALLEQRYLTTAKAADTARAGAAAVAAAYQGSVSGVLSLQAGLSNSLAGTSDSVKRAYAASVVPIDSSTAAIRRAYAASLQAGQADREALASRLAVAAAYQNSIAPYQGVAQTTVALTEAQAKATQSTKQTAESTDTLTRAFGLNRIGMMELQASGINAFQALAAGMSPLRVVTMEGAQTLGAFAQGGIGFTGILRAMVSPIGLAVAGVATLAAGFAVLLERAQSNTVQLRQFNTELKAFGGSEFTTAQGLQNAVRGLGSLNVSRTDQATIGTLIARSPQLNPAQAAQIATTGVNVGAQLGIGDVAGVQKYVEAITSGVDATVKLGMALNAIDGAEAANIDTMARHGQQAQALDRAIKDITDHVANEKKAMDDASGGIKGFGAAWDNMLDKLSNTSAIQGARNAIVGLMNGIARAVTPGGPQTPEENVNAARQALGLPPLPAGALNGVPGVPGGVGNFSVAPGVVMSGQANAFSDMLSHAATKLPPGYGLVITSIGRPNGSASPVGMNSAHVAGNAVDFQIVGPNGERLPNTGADTTGLYAQTYRNVAAYAQTAHPDLAAKLRSGATFGANGGPISGSSPADIGHIDLRGTATATATPSQLRDNQSAIQSDKNALDQLNTSTAQALDLAGRQGIDLKAQTAYYDELNRALGQNIPQKQAEALAQKASAAAVAQASAELQKQSRLQDETTAGVLKTAAAYAQDEVAGYRAAAQAAAQLAVTQGQALDVASKTAEILRSQAAEAINSAAQQIPALQRQVAANENLAAAAAKGTAAEHEAGLQNAVTAASHDALTKAIASGNPALIEQAKRIRDATDALVHNNDAAQQNQQIRDTINSRADQTAVAQLQIGLQGQTPEAIAAATAKLQEEIKLRNAGSTSADKTYQDDLKSLDTWNRTNIALADAQRNQQRLDDGIRSIASTVDNTLTTAIENAFSGQKVTDWATTVKSALASVVAQLADALFIKPLIGSVISGFGFGSAAQSFGSLGSLFGGSSGSTAAGNVVGVLTQSPGGGGLSLSTLSSGASLLSSVSGGGLFGGGSSSGGIGSLFGTGGFTGWLNGIGSHLGFAANASTSTALGDFSARGGSLFGNTTFSSFLGGAGAGFAAGGLLNSLIGGNTMFGTVGSGLGGLAGAAIGSIVPGIGTLIGGLIGGVGGGLLGGLFGNSKPSNDEAGGLFDLSTGRLTSTFSHGNAQIDQPAQQVAQAISQFIPQLLQTSGGALAGTLLLQNGVNTGFTADSTLAPYKGRFSLGTDPTQAINEVELALAKSLTGISDTMKTIIDHITDPSQIASALQFAATYDDLKSAADSAFSSISSDTQQVGPFAQALDQLNTTFQQIADQATQFGLSLDPVNAGLAEAKKRLTEDFNKSIGDAILAITDPTKLMVEQEQQANDQRLADAKAVNGDIEQVNRLHATILAQIGQQEIDTLKQQMQSLIQLRDELTTGSLSGLTGGASVRAANDNFLRELTLVQGGNADEIGNLGTAGTNVVQLSQQAYGNAPQTSSVRAEVLTDINGILASRGFASGTSSTPPGWILTGERGPEWMFQPGGATVLPNGQRPPAGADIAGEIRALRAEVAKLLDGGNRIAQAVGATTVKRLDAVREGLDKRAPADVPRRAVA